MAIDAGRQKRERIGALLATGFVLVLVQVVVRLFVTSNLLVTGPIEVAVDLVALLLANAARRAGVASGAGRAWRLIGIAIAGNALADALRVISYVAGWSFGGNAPTDVLYAVYFAFIFAGVLAFPRRSPAGIDWTGWLDIATVVAAGCLILWDIVFGPALARAAAGGTAVEWSYALYPALDVLLVVAIARAAALATVRASQRSLVLLVPAMLATLAADMSNARLALTGHAGGLSWVDVCWTFGIFLVGVAAAAEHEDRTRGGYWRIPLEAVDSVGAALPYTVVAAAFGLLLDAAFRTVPSDRGLPGEVGLPALAVSVAIIAALVSARQVVAVRRRAAAEQVSRRTERRFRALLERGRDLAFIVDRAGLVRYASPSVMAVLGFDPAAILGGPFAALLDTDSALLAAGMMTAARPDGDAGPDTSLRFRARDGRLTEHAASCRDLRDDPAVGGHVLTAHDVSIERGRIRSLEARYREVADAVHEIIFEADSDGRFTFISPAWTQVMGYPVEATIGRTVWSFVSPDIRDQVTRAPARGTLFEQTVPVAAADGSERWLEIRSRSRFDADERFIGISGIARDTTAQRHAAEELAKARDSADRANRAKSEFVSRMSHELRTPLNSIIGYAELLQLQDLTPEDRAGVTRVLEAGRHLLSLIEEVLDISRIETGRIALELEPVGVKASVDAAVALVQRLADANRIALVNHATPLLAGELAQANVLADRRRLLQILLNLLTNAIKYNRPRGTVWIVLDEPPEPGYVRINIRDTGPGIPEDDIPRLFVPFERLGAERGTVDGTGLGLSVAKSLAEEMHGRLDVVSTPSGSTFGIRLPLTTRPERRAQVAPAALIADLEIDTAPRRILIVEDNEPNRDLLGRVLARIGRVEVTAAATGSEALAAALGAPPDLVLLDLGLPDMDGLQVLRRLKADRRTATIPVAILSADATDDRRAELLAAGALRYLTKPYSVLGLQAAIAEMLGESPDPGAPVDAARPVR